MEVPSSWFSQFQLLVPIPIGYFLQNPILVCPNYMPRNSLSYFPVAETLMKDESIYF